MPKRSTMFGFQKQNKSVYFFQRGKGVQCKNTKGVQCKNTRGVQVKMIEVYNVKKH